MGDQEFETQRRFLHKEPNNGSQDIFFSYFLALLFILSFALFFLPFPSTFLSWKKERSFLMKLEMPAGAKKGGKKGESERGKTKLQ